MHAKICSLLMYLSSLDIHISMRLMQQIQTDRKATEKPNNKQACTNLKDLQMVLSGCMSTIPLEGRNMYQMTSIRWMSRPFPSMLISIKHFSPALRNILISSGPASWTAGSGLCNYWEVVCKGEWKQLMEIPEIIWARVSTKTGRCIIKFLFFSVSLLSK